MKSTVADVTGAHRRALIHLLPGYRWILDNGQFKCPCCDHSGVVVFDRVYRTEVVKCMGGCSEVDIFAWAERQARLAAATRAATGRPLSDYLRGAEAVRSTGLRAGVQRELDRLRDRAEAEVLFDYERAGANAEPLLSSLVDAEPVPEPSILLLPDGTYLLRRGWVHLFHGKPFCGKTPLCYVAMVEVVKAGGFVLLVDYEMGPAGAKALLIELGLSSGQIRDQVLYAYSPRSWTRHQRDELAAEVEARIPDLVVIDSLSRSMATAGLNQNDATETDVWFQSLPTWAVDQFGSAVMLIDHTTRTDGPHPSGSVQKTAAPQFHVWVQNVKTFARDHEDGYSLLTVQKDRSGQRTLGRTVAELRTVLGGSFVLREVDKTTVSSTADGIEVDLTAAGPEVTTELEVLGDLRSAGRDGLAKSAVTGSGEAGKYRRAAFQRLVHKRLAVERRGSGSRSVVTCWAVEFAPQVD